MTARMRWGSWLRPNGALGRGPFVVLAVGQAAIFVAVWTTLRPAVLPGPTEVLTALARLWTEQGLGGELLQSVRLSVEAMALALAAGLVLAYATVIPVLRPLALAVTKGRFLGLVGLTLVLTLAFGGGHGLKLALLTFGMGVFVTTSLVEEVASIPRERFEHARTLGLSEARVFFEVVVRGTADRALEVLRQNAAMGWTMLTMVEGLVRSEGGVGAMLLEQDKHFRLAEVFAIQVVILAAGLLQDLAIGTAARALCPWAYVRRIS